MNTILSRPRALAIAALTTALLAPAASLAYTIVCQGSYLVYKCNDGTTVACVTSDDNGNLYQVDCVAGSGGDHACEDHGGFVGLTPVKPGVAYIGSYKGRLPLEDLAGDGEPNSTVGATLVAICANGRELTCDDETQSCPKSWEDIEALCDRAGGLKSATAYVAFTPKKTSR